MTVDDDENPAVDQQTDDAQEGQETGQGSEGADPPAEGAEAASDAQTGVGDEAKTRKERRFAQLTARMAAERQRADQAERRAADLQALIEAQKTGGTAKPAVSDDDIEARVNQRVMQRESQAKLASVIHAGVAEFGQAEWEDKTAFLHEMGVTNNPVAMQAITDAGPKIGPKIVAALADDPDRLEILMKMEPGKMAREMGKIEAEVSGTVKKVSSAPAPSKNMTPRATPKSPDIYDTKTMTMAEYAKLRAKSAPRHLGGKGG